MRVLTFQPFSERSLSNAMSTIPAERQHTGQKREFHQALNWTETLTVVDIKRVLIAARHVALLYASHGGPRISSKAQFQTSKNELTREEREQHLPPVEFLHCLDQIVALRSQLAQLSHQLSRHITRRTSDTIGIVGRPNAVRGTCSMFSLRSCSTRLNTFIVFSCTRDPRRHRRREAVVEPKN